MERMAFQMLSHQIRVAFAGPEVGEALRYLAVNAEHDAPPSAVLNYEVGTSADGFGVVADGAEAAAGLDAEGVMRCIYSSVYGALHAARPPHLRIHAGCADLGGRRVLFVGRKRAGKTTLMLRLLRDGHPVQGDETVLVEADGTAFPLPRRFHVRTGTFDLCPWLEAAREAAPRLLGTNGEMIHALAPDELGCPWSITPAPVEALVFLKPNHGGSSSLLPLKTEGAAQRLARQTTLPETSPEWVEMLFRLIHCSRAYLLHNGDPGHSLDLLRDEFNA